MTDLIRLRANAKLNLFLRVVRAYEGMHDLETVFHSVALADVVQLSAAPPGELRVEMTASSPGQTGQTGLPAPEDNLVSIAADRMAQLADKRVGATIAVTKNIPIGAGLAGGSADAAATITGLDALWQLGLSRDAILELADALGSDVAFCLDGGAALGTGRGNTLTRLPQPPPMWFVLGMSDQPLLTAAVYGAWDRTGTSGAETSDAIVSALGRGVVADVARHLRNDLLGPAATLRPEIEEGLTALVESGAVGAGMSGSGPTVFGIAANRADAQALAKKVEGRFARVEVVSSAPRGIELL
jgi:4-diphosphocytidyl-2-C-methyl-D-erythritol kinase